MLIALPFLLMGCGASTEYISSPPPKPQLLASDSSLTADCDVPTNIPERELSQIDVEKYWTIDRKNLVTCKNRHAALRDFYNTRDNELLK